MLFFSDRERARLFATALTGGLYDKTHGPKHPAAVTAVTAGQEGVAGAA